MAGSERPIKEELLLLLVEFLKEEKKELFKKSESGEIIQLKEKLIISRISSRFEVFELSED